MRILFDNGIPRQSDRRGRFETCPYIGEYYDDLRFETLSCL